MSKSSILAVLMLSQLLTACPFAPRCWETATCPFPEDASTAADAGATDDASAVTASGAADAAASSDGQGAHTSSAPDSAATAPVSSSMTPDSAASASGSALPDAMVTSVDECGNGVIKDGELCDDGNDAPGDGCNAACGFEKGWDCGLSEPTECTPKCGDGLLVGAEIEAGACDDGNTDSSDGCDSECKVEVDYACSSEPSVCAETCGDGMLDEGEECDDGNGEANDGCVACAVVTGFECDTAVIPSECSDLDECAAPAACSEHEVCNNTPGAFTCACGQGFVGEPGACAQASCKGLDTYCGTSEDSCCASFVVTGGSFGLGAPAESVATIATYKLDEYEVTVGRFRKFVAAYSRPPAAGASEHPLVPDSGWQSAWDGEIAPDSAALATAVQCHATFQTWNTAGDNDQLPINCVTWYEAFAFCAWDGGRLPTEAEWEYAAAGGDSERIYPWGSEPPSPTLAVFDCDGDGAGGCTLNDILPVGSKPAGMGRYGQLDLAGSVQEWSLDSFPTYPDVCNNCAQPGSVGRAARGGNWKNDDVYLPAAWRMSHYPTLRSYSVGFRCARDL